MKKNTLLAFLLLASLFNAQEADGINKIYPAAPSSNNLMKFEEVPVSYYTGVPDINIPIHTLSSSRIQVPVSLNYHILSAKPDDYASEVGLGWNLIAGGTIARTVRGLPDEAIKDNLGGGKQGIGIYIDDFSNHPNFTGNYRNSVAMYLEMISNNQLPYTDENFRRTAFEAAVLNRYDSQYDLYQYNFSGHTGRFIIKKYGSNSFEVVKLDKNNLKITSQHNNKYEPVSFTIVDEYGKQFVFDVVERTSRSFMVNKVSQASNLLPQSSVGQIDEYNSSFHLSSIRDDSGQELAGFQYNPAREVNTSYSSTINHFPVYPRNYDDNITNQIDAYIPPKTQTYTTNNLNKTRTLSRINVFGGGKIDFTYKENDPLWGFEAVPSILSEIHIKDDYEKVIEKISFTQFPNDPVLTPQTRKRIKLTDIIRKNVSNNVISKYKLTYNQTGGSKDLWGFTKCDNSYPGLGSGDLECFDGDVLHSIEYPTGGKTEFLYHPNTYSYTSLGGGGPMSTIDYKLNPYNWELKNEGVSFTRFKETEKYFFQIDRDQTVYFSYFFSALPNTDWRLELFKGDGTIVPFTPEYYLGTLWNNITTSEGAITKYLPAGHYHARLDTDDLGAMFQTFNPVSITAGYSRLRTEGLEKFLFGGGIRIGTIRYLNSDGTVLKQKSFSYQDPSDPSKSSGALVFPAPIKKYEYDFSARLWYSLNSTLYEPVNYNNTFKVSSSDNFLSILKTKGADVGYEYVTVSETGKGNTLYHYKSPRLYNNTEYISTQPPFLPILDEDYKRGHLIKEEISNENNVKLKEKSMDYITQASEIVTGILFRSNPYDVYLNEFTSYDDFLYYKQNCGISFTGMKCSMIETTSDFPIDFSLDRSVIAKVNPVSTTTKEYFGNSVNNFNQTIEQTEYNTLDLPVKNKVNFPDNTVLETSYQYAQEKGNSLMTNRNMLALPLETTTTKTIANDTKTLSRMETNYPTSLPSLQTGNLVLPLSVKSYDIQNNGSSTEVSYDKYDNKGNLQQYTTKDGVSTTIIWGYNQTQPIAKIEGVKLQDIPQNMIDGIVSASNTDAQAVLNNDETSLLAILDEFRNNLRISGYITTYTYDPLIGVRSITPPSGIREFYLYDSANRLEKVVDANGKVLKEYQYHYKN